MKQEQNKEMIFKINMIAILEDLQDQYITELQPELKFGMKSMINNCSLHTKRFIRECDRILSKDNSDNFGVTSDFLRELIENKLLTKSN